MRFFTVLAPGKKTPGIGSLTIKSKNHGHRWRGSPTRKREKGRPLGNFLK